MKHSYNFSKAAVIKGHIKSRSQVEKAIKDQSKSLTSIRLDKDIIDVAKKRAKEEGVGYLTWLNKKLRESIFKEDGLLKRIQKLERVVFKKKAI